MSRDPFRDLGLDRSATPDDVRRARRDLAKEAHPDLGGSQTEMQRVNAAAAAALRLLSDPRAGSADPPRPESTRRDARDEPGAPDRPARDGSDGRRTDIPSFTVEALPVETFEGLLLAASALGEVEDDDPPYELGVLMNRPLSCWCRLYVVPDAGASTVSLAIAPVGSTPLPSLDTIRDAWISELNALDWPDS